MLEVKNPFVFVLAIALIAASIVFLEAQKPAASKATVVQTNSSEKLNPEKLGRFPLARELTGISGYINAEGASVAQLVGKKVVLIDFWTYSCINCQRTIPHINAWYENYRDKGLEIIGVHTPEFEFEKKIENVEAAVKKFGIKYPVVLDNDYATWTAYRNRYWPRKYLIDIDGFVVYDHIGEGAYEETERKIVELLQERASKLGLGRGVEGTASGNSAAEPVEYDRIGSPEVYFGAARNEFLANGIPGSTGARNFPQPPAVELNKLYLVGRWNMQPEYAEALEAGARIIFRYSAKKVFLVAGADSPAGVRILLDGAPLGSLEGGDVEKGGSRVVVEREVLYNLVAAGEYGEHALEIVAEREGLKAYAFSFG